MISISQNKQTKNTKGISIYCTEKSPYRFDFYFTHNAEIIGLSLVLTLTFFFPWFSFVASFPVAAAEVRWPQKPIFFT